MKFICRRHHDGAANGKDRGANPQGSNPALRDLQCLSPSVKEAKTHNTVTREVTGLSNVVMHHRPSFGSDGPEKMNPYRQEPAARVVRRQPDRRLDRNHQHSERRRNPVPQAAPSGTRHSSIIFGRHCFSDCISRLTRSTSVNTRSRVPPGISRQSSSKQRRASSAAVILGRSAAESTPAKSWPLTALKAPSAFPRDRASWRCEPYQLVAFSSIFSFDPVLHSVIGVTQRTMSSRCFQLARQ